MAVTDVYETPLNQMVDKVKDYFAEVGMTAVVAYGRKAINRRDNVGPMGRVVFLLTGGTYTGPKKSGSKSPTAAMRNSYTLLGDVDVDIWAIENSVSSEDELAQESAWIRLHEYTMAGIRKAVQGRVVLGKLGPSKGPTEIREGVAHGLSVRIEIPVHFPPDDAPRIKASAVVTFQQSKPQGATADGEAIPPVVDDVATIEVEAP